MPIYRCDPSKNKKCPKTNCYINVGKDYCMHTDEKQYKMNIFKRIKEWLYGKH